LLQVEYLAAENRILRRHLPDRLRLTNEERSTLAEIGKLFPASADTSPPGTAIVCKQRLGGLLKYYARAA
jgi:hypothetical protein